MNTKKKPAKSKSAAEGGDLQAAGVVGIGASAGGLETFSELLTALPSATGLAFVLVQHLDPKHASILAELLVKATAMPVVEVQDGMRVEPNHVYVIPPNADMGILHGRLHLLTRTAKSDKPQMPIDYFFQSLALDQGNKAVGVVLSGTASDGTEGLKVIKAEGGITFAQEPTTAKYDGMPRAAISGGGVDFILSPQEIAGEVARIGRHPYMVKEFDMKTVDDEQALLNKVFMLVRTATGVDFTYYKHATVRRRIARRMLLFKLEKLSDYIGYLQSNPEETQALYDDMLITVTSFFREPEAFQAVASEVFPKILKAKAPEEPIRIWVAGCATGEEAYALAIALLEFLEDQGVSRQIQLFATDIHQLSIETARQGFYSESAVKGISPTRLRRFFVRVEGGYQVNQLIRDMCIFARHDVTRDPPFSRLDFISCRNVLIYLGGVLQQKIIPMFHWSLNPTGFLLLGVSETIGKSAALFDLLDKKYKIYARKAVPSRLPVDFSPPVDQPPTRNRPRPTFPAEKQTRPELAKGFDLNKETDRLVLETYGPAGVVIDENLEIIQFRGHTSRFLEPAPGQASLNLLNMARPGLKLDLRAAVFQARQKNTSVTKDRLRIKYNGAYLDVIVKVLPLEAPSGIRYFLVLFEEAPLSAAVKTGGAKPRRAERESAADGELKRLIKELAETKEYSRAILEERDATNEELRAANEELQSSTEELQSINEELETAKEELQSSNEELTTVNEELQNRNLELTQLNSDLHNIMASTHMPIVMLSNDLRIRRATAAAHKALNIQAADIGRPITAVKLTVDVPDLEQLLVGVIDTMTFTEQEVSDDKGRWYSLRVRPYKTIENKIEGVVLSFVNIDALKRTQYEIENARDNALSIVRTLREPLIVLDPDLSVILANQAFYDTFKVTPAETENRLIYRAGNGQWNIPKLRELLGEVLHGHAELIGFEVDHEFPKIGRRTMLLNAKRLAVPDSLNIILLAIEDITERRRAEEALKTSEERFRAIANTAADAVLTMDNKGMLVYWNPAAEKIFGYTAAEALGRNFDFLLPKDYPRALRKRAAKFLSTGEPDMAGQIVERKAIGKNRVEFPIEASVSTWKSGKATFHTVMVRDITERKRAKELSDALNDINAVIHSTLDLDEIMRTVAVEAVKALGCESDALILQEGERWKIRYLSGLPEEFIGVSMANKEAQHLTLVARTKSPLIVNDTLNDPRVNQSLMRKLGIRSFVAVPLIVRETVIGVMAFHHRAAPLSFTEIEIDFAGKVGASVSLALENARLFAEERDIAETLQAAILTMPARVDGLDFGYAYESATVEIARVGGDFYDLFELERNKVGVVVGDVSGKGLAAAGLTSQIKNTIRAYCRLGGPPSLVLARTNDLLQASTAASMFATVFLGILDTATGKLTYCSAGHPPPFLKSGSRVSSLVTRSSVIGVFDDIDFVDDETTLGRNRILVAYTDGAVEARRGKEFFREERLIKVLKEMRDVTVQELPHKALERITTFSDGVLADDIAFLAVALKRR